MVYVDNINEKVFLERLEHENVIAFCAGQALTNLCKKYPLLSSKIICIVDNFKYGQTIELGGQVLPIVSIDHIDDKIKDCMLIISSLQFSVDLIKQLDNVEKFNNLKFIIPILLDKDYDRADFILKDAEQIIPKKIHYCWFGGNEIPKHFKDNIESWKKFCPDYEIIRWDESNYDYTKNKYMKQAYEAKKWGFVPDYARLDIINTHGGIYLDTDVEVIKSFDDLLQFKLFCGFEIEEYVNFGIGFGSVANNTILKDMMSDYDKEEFILSNGELNLVPSPSYQTKILKKYGLIANGHSQKHKDFVVFSSEYFSPFNGYGIGNITHNTYSIHQYAATWFTLKQQQQKKNNIDNIKFLKSRLL